MKFCDSVSMFFCIFMIGMSTGSERASRRSSPKSTSPVNLSHIPDDILTNEIMSRLPNIADIKSLAMVNRSTYRAYNKEKDLLYRERAAKEFGIVSMMDAYNLLNTIFTNYKRLKLNVDRMRDYITEMYIKNIAILDTHTTRVNFDENHAIRLISSRIGKMRNKEIVARYIVLAYSILNTKQQEYEKYVRSYKSYPNSLDKLFKAVNDHSSTIVQELPEKLAKETNVAITWIQKFEERLTPLLL